MSSKLRNIAIIAHVDHGKTTLVDKLLKQSGMLSAYKELSERVMDSNDLEKERGITILSKNTAIDWKEHRINIVDTPGHADFGGEVERIMSMVDSVLLLVDAVDGPMPQTRFVTQKAFAAGLKPIVVINKIDRPGARVDWVTEQVFDLFVQLDASDEQLDFTVIYASALQGYASEDSDVTSGDMTPLLDTIIEKVPSPNVQKGGGLQLQVTSLDYSSYLGAIAIGRINRGVVRPKMSVKVVDSEGKVRSCKIGQVMGYRMLERIEVEKAEAGDIIAITGIDEPKISDTICDVDNVEALPSLVVDEPTINMTFQVNNSPFAGRDGKYLTSRQILARLQKELIHNVALRVELLEDSDKFKVSGRGELHLSILIETMVREGYELAVSRPEVIIKEIDGVLCEPYEFLTIDVEQIHQGAVMEKIGQRKAILQNMQPDDKDRVRLDFSIPARGLIGFQSEFMTITSGTGLIYHTFEKYGELVKDDIGQRKNGVMISNGTGKAVAYAIYNLQERAKMMVEHGQDVYEGQIVGINSRDNDLVVNVLKGKQLTNIRASGTDDALILVPPVKFTLEQALEFIDDDELVEVTSKAVRIRKKYLSEVERKRHQRNKMKEET